MARVVELPDPADHEPIQGPRLRLRPLTPDDLPTLMRWLADPKVQEFNGQPPESLAQAHDIYLVAEDAPGWRFAIEEQGRPVDEIQYYHPFLNERWSAGIDILIGEPGYRNRGLGQRLCGRCCSTCSR
jgi:RimJ/RimL family protein N-acetyltransferase